MVGSEIETKQSRKKWKWNELSPFMEYIDFKSTLNNCK